MSDSHVIQYIIIAVIAVAVIAVVVKNLIKIRNCHDTEDDICQCCSSKSLCGKKKKSKGIAESGK